MPWCFGASGSVRARSMPWSHHCAAEFHTFWPGDDELVAVAHRAAPEAGEVGARAGLAEELAPRVLAREQPRARAHASARRCRRP